jgi:hypothetical protein
MATTRGTVLVVVLGTLAFARTAPAQPDTPADLDRAIALLNQARESFRNVRDYECRIVKRERVNGTLLPESVLTMKARNQPFAVYLRCESADDDQGMEICYAAGRNDGKMRVRPAGTRGVLGFWTVDTHDPRAFEKNRHAVTEAGLGHLLDSTARYWDVERRLNKTVVRIAEEQVGGRACVRIETVHPDRGAGAFYGYRCVLWLDKETHLPAGAETYDWPSPGGAAGGELLESYRFQGLRINPGLGDNTFDH